MLFKEKPDLVYTGLTDQIGKPREYEKNLEEPCWFDKDFDLAIPLSETNEYPQKGKFEAQNATPPNKELVYANSDQRTAPDDRSAKQSSENSNKNFTAGKEELFESRETYTPIKSLNTFLFDWKIKARVTKKHSKKQWRNARGVGFLLNIELIDQQGTQIQATFFNEQADYYEACLRENQVYTFANGQVKMAIQKYTSIKNDYSIVFDKNSTIELVEDDMSIMAQGFCFISINEITEFEQMRTIDTIGCVVQISALTQINIKQTGTQKDRRNVIIADESNYCVTVSLWGSNARNDSYSEGQVLALRGARVSDYNGRSLNSGDEHSQIFVDCKCTRTKELQRWWSMRRDREVNDFMSITGGQANSIVNPSGDLHSKAHSSETPQSNDRDNFKLCDELVSEVASLSRSSQPFTKFFKISGFVRTIFNDEKIM